MNGFDETRDFIVVGSGGGSMCAGLLMRTHGKSVVILEKTELVGGTTAKSGGVMWVPNNRFMARDGIEDSFEAGMAYLNAAIGDASDAPGATMARREAYVRESPRMIDFLHEQGVKLTRVGYWPDYYDELPGSSKPGRTVVAELFNLNELREWKDRLRPGFINIPATLEEGLEIGNFMQSWKSRRIILKVGLRALTAALTGKRWIAAGAALQGRMLQASLRAGIEFRLNSPVKELIIEDGKVTGVLMQKNGQDWKIGARLGVLVNAGGFAHNQAMRDKYQPGTSAAWSSAPETDTGEMINEMARQGAATAQMEEFVGQQHTLPPGHENNYVKDGVQQVTAKPHAILVDQTGTRYMNEGGSYMAYCKNMLERDRVAPAIPSWAVFDTQFIRKYLLAGTMPGTKKPKRWFDEGYMKKAETIEELAGQIGAEPVVFKATIDRFNGFVEQNHDDDFLRGDRAYDRWLGDPCHKPSETLGKIEQAPFYAIPVVPGDVGTYGGVVADEYARVLREDGSVIPGLYATGVSTASAMGRVYPGAGCSIGPAFLFGYLAAKHALSGIEPD